MIAWLRSTCLHCACRGHFIRVVRCAHRHRTKPGLIGWAAVNGSRGPLHTPADVKRRVALDVEYIERQTLWLDLKILLLTGPRLLGARSAVR